MNKFLVRGVVGGSLKGDWQTTYETENDRLYLSDISNLMDQIKEDHGNDIQVFFNLIYKLGDK